MCFVLTEKNSGNSGKQIEKIVNFEVIKDCILLATTFFPVIFPIYLGILALIFMLNLTVLFTIRMYSYKFPSLTLVFFNVVKLDFSSKYSL